MGARAVRTFGLAARALPGVALGILLGALPAAAETGRVRTDRFDVVVLDPGHGGDDHGARGARGLMEKEIVLDVAKRLAARLREQGLEVVMTRSDDRFVSLEERTERANRAGADLFLSIHANASRARTARGIETFFASLDATDEAARELAAAENRAVRGGGGRAPGGAAPDPLRAILGDLAETEHLEASQEFARLAQHRIATEKRARSRGVKQAPFVVLLGVEMPSVLVEIGFLTNPLDERALARSEERDRLADGLAEAVAVFGERHDARRGLRTAGAPGAEAAP